MRLIGKLVAETDEAGRLQMWGNGPGRPSARLRFTPGALMLETPDCESVSLDWADCLNFDEPRLAPPSGMWKIDFWAMTRRGSVGVGIRMIGSYEQKTSSIADATMTAWRRRSSKLVAPLPGSLVPIVPKSVNVQSQNTELDTLAALVAVLAATPEWRPRLDDAERMRRLAHDVTHGMRTSVVTPTGMGWDSLDTFRAMRACGYVHPFGRPLDDRPQPPVEQIVADVIRRMEANPYRAERTNDPRKVERIVRRYYLRIEPWPFAALAAD